MSPKGWFIYIIIIITSFYCKQVRDFSNCPELFTLRFFEIFLHFSRYLPDEKTFYLKMSWAKYFIHFTIYENKTEFCRAQNNCVMLVSEKMLHLFVHIGKVTSACDTTNEIIRNYDNIEAYVKVQSNIKIRETDLHIDRLCSADSAQRSFTI